jgi:hypothetical protein
MKKTIRILLVFAIVLLSAIATMADPPGPPAPGNGNNNPPLGGGGVGPVGAPLDGGLSLLLIGLGAAYGGKKLFKASAEKKTEE